MASNSAQASMVTLQLPGYGGPEDEGFWKDYFKGVTDEDNRKITNWQKSLDTLLVYIGLFIGVLTAFVIQMSSMLQPSPEDATNKIFIAIYNHTMNASSPIDLEQYIRREKTPATDQPVFTSAFLLYTSLAISIMVAALALVISIWLSRYQRSLTETGPTIHERIKKRHETYTGLIEWKLPTLIEILPVMAWTSLTMFTFFISESILTYRITHIVVATIFDLVGNFFILTASFAAFIPDAPFHSPVSDFIRFIFRILPADWTIGPCRIRTLGVTVICAFGFFTLRFKPLTFLIPMLLLSLCERAEKKPQLEEQPQPRLFSQATLVHSSCAIVITLTIMMRASPYREHPLLFYLPASLLSVVTLVVVKVSQWTPIEGQSQAEAVAWIIKTQPSHDLVVFRKAAEIAQSCPHLRPTLLQDILPVLEVFIKSIQGDTEQGLRHDEKLYITLLAVLVDFKPCKADFLRNKAALKRPVLSDELKEKLRMLGKGDCVGHSLPMLFGCVKAEAEFILGKVGEEDSMQKESTPVESRIV